MWALSLFFFVRVLFEVWARFGYVLFNGYMQVLDWGPAISILEGSGVLGLSWAKGPVRARHPKIQVP